MSSDAGEGLGIANSGFGGIATKQGATYRVSLYARTAKDFAGTLRISLLDEQDREIGSRNFSGLGVQWNKLSGEIVCQSTTTQARLCVLVTEPGQIDVDFVSLFPQDTWKQRPNGMRADLMQILADMKPAFVRFPGGCIVEGKTLDNAYRWKDTIGAVASRRQNWNRWADWDSPQYYQSYGLGFFEFFQLCEDIGAQPVPILNCGMACQFQSGQLVPLDELQPWIQDALDLVEFANGSADSPWGSKRAEMGHPEPFQMKYLGVGNEQWGPEYFPRYERFLTAIRAKYPDLHIITTSGPGVDDDNWQFAYSQFKTIPADIVDEHYYRSPQWFLDHDNRYDNYDRRGPKVFAGEFAAHGPGRRNDLQCALSEAAFMTGLVRNADVVCMSSYAPLFNKVGSTQWLPDLIWFDNTRVFGTPSYYVQKLFSLHRGDEVIPLTVTQPQPSAMVPQGQIGVGTWLTKAEFKDIRVEQDSQTVYASKFSDGTNGWTFSRGNWQVKEGCLQQTSTEPNVRAMLDDTLSGDLTLTLKARALSGDEGFLISFQGAADDGKGWWNLGGWGNRQHGLEAAGVPQLRVPGHIETGRWYDVKIELQGDAIRCYLDGRKIHDVRRLTSKDLYAVASYDRDAGETILKVVNVSDITHRTAIRLQGARDVGSEARQILLTSDNPADVNSLDAPTQVAPREAPLAGVSSDFPHDFPAHSLTVLRLKTPR